MLLSSLITLTTMVKKLKFQQYVYHVYGDMYHLELGGICNFTRLTSLYYLTEAEPRIKIMAANKYTYR